jgi:hypothetical protein
VKLQEIERTSSHDHARSCFSVVHPTHADENSMAIVFAAESLPYQLTCGLDSIPIRGLNWGPWKWNIIICMRLAPSSLASLAVTATTTSFLLSVPLPPGHPGIGHLLLFGLDFIVISCSVSVTHNFNELLFQVLVISCKIHLISAWIVKLYSNY